MIEKRWVDSSYRKREDYNFIHIYVQLSTPHHWTTFTRDNTFTMKDHRRDMWLLLLYHMDWNQTYFELEGILQKSRFIGRIVWTTWTTKYEWFSCCIFRVSDLEPWPPWQQWRYVSLCITVWVCHELHRQQSFDLSAVRLQNAQFSSQHFLWLLIGRKTLWTFDHVQQHGKNSTHKHTELILMSQCQWTSIQKLL